MINNIDPLRSFNTGLESNSDEEFFTAVGEFQPEQPTNIPQQEDMPQSIQTDKAPNDSSQEEFFTSVEKLEEPQETWGQFLGRNALLIGKGVGKRALQLPSNILDISKSVSRYVRPSKDDERRFLTKLEASGLIKDKKLFEKGFKELDERKEDASFGGPLSFILEHGHENYLRPAGEKFAKEIDTVGDLLGIGPIKPKGRLEELLYSSAKDAGDFVIPAMAGLAFGSPAIGAGAIASQAILPNIGKKTAQYFNAPKSVQKQIKLGMQVGIGLFNAYRSWTPKMAAETEYAALEAATPQVKNKVILMNSANKALEPINEALSVTLKDPTKEFLMKKDVQELVNKFDYPQRLESLVKDKRSINKILRAGVPDKDAKRLLENLRDAIKTDIFSFAKNTKDIPTKIFINSFKHADELTYQLHKTAISLDWLSKNTKWKAGIGSVAIGILGQGLASLTQESHPGVSKGLQTATLGLIAIPAGLLGVKGLNFLLKGPAIQKHYLAVIGAAAQKNMGQVIKNVKKLDKEIKKKVPESSKKQ